MDFSDKCTSYRLFHDVILPIEEIANFFGASYISGDSEKDSIGFYRVGEKPQKVPALPLLGAQTRKHPILGYHLSGERWRALAKKLCHKINDFYW